MYSSFFYNLGGYITEDKSLHGFLKKEQNKLLLPLFAWFNVISALLSPEPRRHILEIVCIEKVIVYFQYMKLQDVNEMLECLAD